MDFFQIALTEKKGGVLEASPDFLVKRTEDLMVRAKNFYAIWDEDAGLWSTDEYDVQRIVDSHLKAFVDKNPHIGKVKYMRNFSSNGQSTFRKYMSQIGDNSHQLDESLTFKGQKVSKKDYVSKRLPYDLAPGDHSAWDDMVGKLYKPAELEKIEWFIGSIVSGDSRKNQKFLVLHGPPGAGKGTIIDIVLMLFDGYTTTFDAKALGSNGNQFAAAAFGGNPLVAIQHDGDLSRIEDNTLLNSIVSHEVMKVNEKYKPAYDTKLIAALIMGTNKPVKITDAQSGLIRRLIDVHPSGERHAPQAYHAIKDRIPFQLGAIAQHCLDVYQKLGKNYYSNYRPLEMMFKTNAFFNFIEAHYDIFEKQNGVSAKQGWNLYKEYCQEADIEKPMSMYAFKAELSNYFEDYHDRIILDGVTVRSYYQGFKAEPFKTPVDGDVKKFALVMDETTSLLDLEFAEYAAQYTKADGSPLRKWENVKTTLAEIDTSREHYVMGFPMNHIIVDFDIKDENGNKSLERNLEAAAHWPATYAELSKSGDGVHLHYVYDGDPAELDPSYTDGIEIKVYTGNSALRRRLSKCNNVSVATINSGLPLKEKKRVLEQGVMTSEKGLRALIAKNLRKEIHPGTKPSIDFIKHILDEAYDAGWPYDVTDMRQAVTSFANNSTHKPLECLLVVQSMQWRSADKEVIAEAEAIVEAVDNRLVFFDCEVYSNLFVICWKFEGDPDPTHVTRMINPKPHEVEALFRLKLVGFNNRNYDNHILWAAALGFSNEQLYTLSQRIINGAPGSKFGEAYNVSWTDIYDYSSQKQGLKKWQIELGLKHQEMDIPWDRPVPKDRIMDVVEYCVNDVMSTEKVHEARSGDYKARQILAALSGLTANDTTAKHTAAIVFGKDKNPQRAFVYTDLTKEFPGYVFEGGKSTYRGETVGEGGYVYAEPGLHRDVALLDVASMHPTSIGVLNLFGDYTPRFMALVEAQLAIKNGRYDDAKTFFEGKLIPYIDEIESLAKSHPAAAKKAAADLRWGLKIAINIVYGLTSAKFDNPFRDIRNADNIVAKRGALFMIDLKHALQDRGRKVVHIKTDSVKIPDATQEDIDFVKNFGSKYGYTFEYNPETDQYSKLGLVNDAVYVAKEDKCITNCWHATGTQYLHPYVFKKLFGYDDDINALDLGETKHVQQGALYLDFGHHNTDHEYMGYVIEAQDTVKAMKKAGANEAAMDKVLTEAIDKLIFVGKTGRFMPVKDGYGGGQLWRIKDGKPYAVQGTKGYLWVDSEIGMGLPDDAIDYGYFDGLVDDALANLEKYVEDSSFASVDEFLS